MNLDQPEVDIFESIHYPPDDDSGSQYEESSQSDHAPKVSIRSRSKSTERKAISKVAKKSNVGRPRGPKAREEDAITQSESNEDVTPDPKADDHINEQARAWAASFVPPELDEIRTPTRRTSRKRWSEPVPNVIRSKRLRAYYNDSYRELLNAEINTAAYGEPFDKTLEASQIGSVVWSAEEKDLLFSSLPRLGRDDVRGIAAQITTKSESEIQQYLQFLEADIKERKMTGTRDFIGLDISAADEISEEFCLVLDRAGHALAIRQEIAEEKVEKSKWSDIWLIDEKTSLMIERRRKNEAGEDALQELLPAGNLFILKNWLELSSRVFMNSGEGQKEDNWESLAESGESPAVRATAFEDFHSLAVSILKKLLSTTLYCTESRLRAGNYHYGKHAEVTSDDVQAAVNILGLKASSSQFWIECAKRNHLEVVDDGVNDEDGGIISLTPEDVEQKLRSTSRSRSCSRSRSRSVRPQEYNRRASVFSNSAEIIYDSSPAEMDITGSEDAETDSSDSILNELPTPSEDDSFPEPDSPNSRRPTTVEGREALEDTQESYLEALDMEASQKEEARLWAMLDQEPPFELATATEDIEPPKALRADPEDVRNWRNNLEYWSSWETSRTPITESAFLRNQHRQSRRAKAREKGLHPRARDSEPSNEELSEVEPSEEETSPDTETVKELVDAQRSEGGEVVEKSEAEGAVLQEEYEESQDEGDGDGTEGPIHSGPPSHTKKSAGHSDTESGGY